MEHIKALPDELLSRIFDLETQGQCLPRYPTGKAKPNDSKCAITSVSRVCWHWHRLSIPILYRRIRVRRDQDADLDHSWRWKRLKLFENIQYNPRLRTYTQEACIELIRGDPRQSRYWDNWKADNVIQLLKWWEPTLRAVRFETSTFENSNIPSHVTLQTSQIRHLQSLEIGFSISLSFLLQHFRASTLKRLHLDQWTWTGGSITVGDVRMRLPPSHDFTVDEQLHMPAEFRYTGELKQLSLGHSNLPPRLLRLLLMWPRALEELEMKFVKPEYDARMVQSLIDMQMHSLQSITIGTLVRTPKAQQSTEMSAPASSDDIPLLTNCLVLERVSLSSRNILSVDAIDACSRIMGKSVKHLTINFAGSAFGRDDSWFGAHATRANWLIDFVRAWRMQEDWTPDRELTIHLESRRLKQVHSFTNLEQHSDTVPDTQNCDWCRVLSARDLIKVYGARLTWSSPSESSDQARDLTVWMRE